ncbi:GGDEF domain-containing protein [Enhygromyxa salina]|uniref:diguanylate cyclase n=1 Tax=Enhygromyxa salina TaxID=215803 RepID=A0A2S9YQ31_9BACT|nr:GGDEF domain-containing protein [Enhygromyxa salina]PRQ07190.1 Response regulator PleD [Enhygromyxa salina]
MNEPPDSRLRAGPRGLPSTHQTVPDSDGGKPPLEQRSACLVVMKGDNVGHKYDLDRELVAGRDNTTSIYLDDGLVSRSHAKFTPDAVGVRLFDLCSTNGTFVNDRQVNSTYLDDGDQIRIGKTILKFIHRNDIEAAFHAHIYSLTRFDGLTGVHNRPTFDNAIANAIAKVASSGAPLALMLFDIDHFKRCNDTHGHRAGDHVLREVSATVSDNAREGDFVARYGGEEFAVIIHGLAPPGPARYADHIRALVGAKRFEFEGQAIAVTISAGVASWSASLHSPEQLIELADQCLYRAKQAGRNQVIAV